MIEKIKNTLLNKRYSAYLDVRVAGLLLFGVVSVLIAWSSLRTLQINYELQKKEAVLSQKNANQQLNNENLKLTNAYFQTDEYLELTARRQFNKGAAGEKLYLVPEEVAIKNSVAKIKDAAAQVQSDSSKKSKYQQNFDAWMDFLLHHSR